jgi:phospholipid/cholesterol/gamma-HCH transport system substrate-binding protein
VSSFQRAGERIGLDPRALIGVAALAGGTLIWVLAFTGGISGLFSGSTHTIKANFQSIEAIVANDPVRVAGVQVGTVSGESEDPGGHGATLTMQLDSNAPAIYSNAGAAIIWRTALGANDAVALTPGTRSAGLLGSRTLPQSQDSNQVELDEITRVLTPPAQSGIRTFLQQLGPAFSSHPPLAEDLGTLAKVAPIATVGIGAVRGEIPDTDLRNLVRNTAQAATALDVGTGASETQQFVESAATTLSSLSGSQQDLRTTIADAGRVLPPLTVTANGINRMLGHLDPLVLKLTPIAPHVAPTLRVLHPAVVDADTLLHAARPLLSKLRPTVDSLADSARVGTPVLNNLNPSLVRLRDEILPGLAEQGPEEKGHPAYTMIGPTFVGLGGLSSFFDNNGFIANLSLGVDAQGEQLLPCTEDFAGTDVLVCDSLADSLTTLLGGGEQTLQSLAKRTAGTPAGAAVARQAAGVSKAISGLSSVRQLLSTKDPAVAQALFKPVSGVKP